MKNITPEEAGRLLAVIDLRDPFGPRDHAMLLFDLHTGLRVSELVGIDVHMVALQGQPRQAIYIQPALAKYSHERTIPLNAVARKAVADLLAFNRSRGFSVAPEAPLFVTRKHERVSVRLVQRLVETLRERSGLDVPATPHSLRHRFASTVAETTGNLRYVQRLLGHQRLETSVVYTHPSRAELERAVAAIEGAVI